MRSQSSVLPVDPLLPATSSFIACAWVLLALALIFVRGKNLSLDRNVTDRLKFHAIPVAESVLYHGRAHDYTAYRSIAQHFQTPTLTAEELIPWGAVAPVPAADGTYFWAADDRGMADYVIGAFSLFGPEVASLYKFYFVLLTLTCGFALLGFWRQPTMTALWLLALAGISSCLGLIPLASLSASGWDPPALFEPRILDLLALIPTLHLGLAAWIVERWTIRSVVALVGQVAFFMLCYQARSSVGWEAVFVVTMNAAAIWRAFISTGHREDGQQRSGTPTLLPLGVFLLGFVTLTLYEHVMYHPRYFKDMGARTVWHNALMGLGANKELAAKYKLGIDDHMAIEAVIADMRAHHDPRLTDQWTKENITSSLGGWAEFDWFAYESAARTLYFRIWRRHFIDMVHCYLLDKPFVVLSGIGHALRSRSNEREQRKLYGLYFNPVGFIPLFIAAPALVILTLRRRARFLTGPSMILLLFSIVPGMLFYAVPLTMMGVFASLTMLVYATAALVLQAILPLGFVHAQPAPAPELV